MADYLLLVRHGATRYSVEKRYAGTQHDIPLSREGRDQAERLARKFKHISVQRLFSSPLHRTQETAGFIQNTANIPLEIEHELSEIDFGEWEGKTFAEIEAEHPDAVTEWAHSSLTFEFPGGEDVQSFLERARRVTERFRLLNESSVCAVTHGGMAGAIITCCLGIGLEHQHAFAIRPGTMVCLEVSYLPGRLVRLDPLD